MSKHLLLALLLFSLRDVQGYITYIEKRFPLEGERSPPGSPWPLPREWKKSSTVLTIDPNDFYLSSNAERCNIIRKAVNRYMSYILIDSEKGRSSFDHPVMPGVQVNVENKDCGYPKLIKNTDQESYNIEIAESGEAKISAKTVWSALWGLETFSQLVYQDTNHAYLINATAISDSPRYGYRGILLDSARHFQPLKVLKQNLDAMSFNKFNTFHWHLVDDQSFPFESKIYPNLTVKGAYSPRHVYTQNDVKDIIEYARLRGIRVIPEFDTPGHTQGFAKAYPDLITPCYGDGKNPYTPNYPEHADSEMLNPIQNYTYEFFNAFFKEVKDVFEDEYIHLGMDEVYPGCWKSNPDIKDFMKRNGMTKISEVEQYYVDRTLANVNSMGYKYMIWQDPIDNGVKAAEDTIVEVWKDKYLDSKLDYWYNYIKNIAAKNYTMVLSAPWYLNYISYGQDWKKYYEADPRGFDGTEAQKDLVIGGEACMWGEYVDGANLIPRLWPRASAVGERLWSREDVRDVESAKFRLDEQRCRMLRRGIPTQPILNGYCGDYEWEMNEEIPASAHTVHVNLTVSLFVCLISLIDSGIV
ncbi:beta-hexosaminidase subunit beta-like isoform X2 [Tachypleus tridentatus]|uniref:beta-hexosaminidase subunit beta-like isoform X2 n=2 Tax=Tachypleus tridentatus TaxID=6853 RepID=UPI003FCEEA88